MNRLQYHAPRASPVLLVMLVILASTGVLVWMAPVVHAQPPCPTNSYQPSASLILTLNAAAGSSPIGAGNDFVITGTTMNSACTVATGTLVYLDPGSTVTISALSSGSNANEEWCISGLPGTCSQQTIPLGSTNSSEPVPYTYYEQFDDLVSYTVSGGGSGYAPPTFTCLQFGVLFTYIATQAPTHVWADAACTYAFSGQLGGSGSSERWVAVSGTSGVIASASSLSPVYYNQFLLSFGYSVTGGGVPTVPSLVSYQFGATFSTPLTTTVQGYWADSGATWTVTNPIPGSTSTEQWASSGTTSGTSGPGVALSLEYYHQYSVSFAYAVDGGGSGYLAPSLTSTSLGNSFQSTLSTAARQYWIDVGSPWSVGGQLGGSSSSERWDAKSPSGTISSPSPITVAYYHQYSFTASYALLGGGTRYSPPSFAYTSYGSSTSTALGSTPSPIWVDAGSAWTADNPLSGSSLAERWETNATTAGSAISPTTLSFTYFHQFYVTFGYSVLGGGTTYSPPVVQAFQFGVPASEISGWADAGSRYSFTNPLPGSSSTERWFTGSAGGLIQSLSVANATYYRQYDLVLSYSVVGATIQLPPPTLNSTFLGAPQSEQLQAKPTDYWLDSGASWVASKLLPGSGKAERWMTGQTAEGTVRASSTVAFTYFDQYAAGFSYTIDGGGSPQPPSLSYTAFSVPVNATISSTRVVYWFDTHSNWSLTNPVPGQSNSERWIAAQGASGTARGPFNETATYVHQYYVQVKTNAKEGGFAEVSSGWYDNGGSVTLNATASPGWSFSGWSGTGTGSYSGTILTQTVPISSSINETAVFYAGLTLVSGTGGSVQYTYGQVNGSIQGGANTTLYVVPGTSVSVSSTPATVAFAFRGWSGNLTGVAQNSSLTVAAPVSVSATFGLDYTDIGVFYGVAIAITVLTVYVFFVRRRHEIFGSGELISIVK